MAEIGETEPQSNMFGAAARDKEKLNSIIESGGFDGVRAFAAGVSNGEDVLRIFDSVGSDLGFHLFR